VKTTPAGVFERIGRLGVVAILRSASARDASESGLRLIDAGFEVIEVSFNTPEATTAIRTLRAERPDALVGAGTVLTADQARGAVAAGASFLLSPAFGEPVAAVAADAGLPYIPGVFTATDVWRCLMAGLEVLKLFPAAPLGHAGMRALLEPVPQVRALPTGGITIDSAADWMRAGAFALGMGGSLAEAADPAAAAAALRRATRAAGRDRD
jgi:2-dehydro-3-deoxyphosphogluconate aldolase/(4S)-4-hydroxy-2-oxoglutarate aldolase